MKLNIKIILGFLLSFIVLGITGVCAANIITSNEIKFDNTNSNLKSTDTQSAIDELYSKVKPIEFKLGDYVQMTPTKTSFTIPKTLTGYTTDRVINPSELNLWRVIRINDDKTVEMISEYTSSSTISFSGQIGYQNYIGTLNYIAKQYENPKYTSSSRHAGYNGQTEYITDSSKLNQISKPWDVSTSYMEQPEEILGAGDNLYTEDENLILSTLGKLSANMIGTDTAQEYWIASRGYYYNSNSSAGWSFYGRSVYSNAITITNFIYYRSGEYFENGQSAKSALRPIVTLKSDIRNISGNGTSESPYILN